MEATASSTVPAVKPAPIAVVMGVSGSGKTRIGEALAEAIGARFVEGDRYHPPENISRMKSGLPLRDEDRWSWLDAIAEEIAEATGENRPLVVACSALKRVYRDRLRRASRHILFIHLDVDRATAADRVASRQGHFMPASLIDSQFSDLEPPEADERAFVLDSTRDPAVLVPLAAAALTTFQGKPIEA
jgi:gluconokinase